MLWEFAIDHLRVDVLANEFHVPTNVPKFLTNLEIFSLTFVTGSVNIDALIFVVYYYILIIA
jgi:hypothetical protein